MNWLFRVAPFLDGRKRKRLLETQANANQGEPASPTIDMQPTSPTEPACPTCGAAMFKRFNRQTSQMFWGCTHYPRCKGTRAV
jgi:restriction system protein